MLIVDYLGEISGAATQAISAIISIYIIACIK